MDVSTWLRDLGLEDYVQAFQANHIDAEVLSQLTADDLIGLGITSIGHRRKLLDAIAAFQSGTAPESPQPTAVTMRPSHAERRQLTVLFVDLVGSTELAARLDPRHGAALARRSVRVPAPMERGACAHRQRATFNAPLVRHRRGYLPDGVKRAFDADRVWG